MGKELVIYGTMRLRNVYIIIIKKDSSLFDLFIYLMFNV